MSKSELTERELKLIIGYTKLLTENQSNQHFILTELNKIIKSTSVEEVLKIAEL